MTTKDSTKVELALVTVEFGGKPARAGDVLGLQNPTCSG